ncbi:MAG: DUF2079 domain-containing protein [Ruminococcaceae bacterium]|nr:DUF2079 domain-containing protein [Oscillospiraceae bacterium]
MTKKAILSKFSERVSFPDLVRKLVLGWLFAVVLEVLMLPAELRALTSLDGPAAMSLGRVLLIACGVAVVLLGISLFVRTLWAERVGIPVLFAVLAVLSLRASYTTSFLWLCILLALVLVVYAIRGWKGDGDCVPQTEKDSKVYIVITAALGALLFLFICAWTVGRYLTFSTPTYDFGIFAQMFHNMKESGLPITTVERDGALSHFAVHVSPIYYLMLPIYWLFPSPITLQVLQAAVIASAVIPLWKIGRHHGLSADVRTLLCAVLVLFPALSAGASYDLHENCFLAPLVLWLFYGIDKKSIAVTAVSAVLVLCVKEDAAMYVAVIALWLIVKTLLRFKKSELKPLIMGIAMFAVSLVWFFLTTGYLASVGDGVMTYRYDNFMYDGTSSLVTVVKSVILNPMKALFECVDSEKLKFIALTMLPLAGLPLITRRYERLILLIPYLLVNLMSDYQYQHDIMFQYNFGSAAFLFYMTVVNLSDLKLTRSRVIPLVTAVAIGAGCLTWAVIPTAVDYPKRAIEKAEYYDSIRAALDTIPEGTPAAATNTYTAYLSDREVLYDVKRCTWEQILETEYVALGKGSTSSFKNYASEGKNNGFDNLTTLLEAEGYVLFEEVPGVLVIYKKQ